MPTYSPQSGDSPPLFLIGRQVKENNDAIAAIDRKVAALCEDISNANDELDDLDDEDEEEDDTPAKAKSRQVSRPSRSPVHADRLGLQLHARGSCMPF